MIDEHIQTSVEELRTPLQTRLELRLLCSICGKTASVPDMVLLLLVLVKVAKGGS